MLYEALFHKLPYAAAVLDADLVVRDANAAFAALHGLARERAVGAPASLEFDCGPEGAGLLEMARRAVASGGAFEAAVALPGGRRAVLRLCPLGAREPLALATLEEATGADGRVLELYRSLRALKHEMNNPLTGALGNITLLLRRGDLDEKTRRRLATAEQEIKKVSALVMRLSELAPVKEPR